VRNSFEKRLVRLEQLAAKRNEKLLVCNCRWMTVSHDSSCLAAIMKGGVSSLSTPQLSRNRWFPLGSRI
jgi:hypothetical protein